MKGSKPAGTTTQTTINPTQQAQLPYLQQGWNAAGNLYNTTPVMPYYPGTTLAPYNPAVQQGYEGIYNTGAGTVAQGLQPNATGAFNTAVTGGYGVNNSPAYGAYQQFMQGANPYQQQLATLATGAAGGNLGLTQLGQVASGAYLNSNPYMSAMVQAAADPVTRNYQTATAPQTDFNFANAGRYGSGAMAGLRSTNEQNLGKALADQSSNLYGNQYARERQLQDAAAYQYAGLQNQGQLLSGQLLNNLMSSQQYGATGLQSGYQSGNAAAMQALQQYPQFASAMFTPARAELEAGQGLTQMTQAQINDLIARYKGEQAAPWDTLTRFEQAVGNPTSGSSTVSNPYFQNQTADALAGIGGTLGIGKQLGLFGSGAGAAGAAAPGWAAGTGSGAGIFTNLATGATTDLAGITMPTVAGSSGLSSLLPTAAAWIICTELKNQGKMPKRYWLTGVKAFAGYPDVVKRGYYVWAIPSVFHLRRRPDSLYSRFLGKVFGWRAEDLAARAGVAGARKLWRGRAVTCALALPCLALGMLVPEQDWQSVYRERAA